MRPPWLLPVALAAGVLAAGCALDQKGLGASTHATPVAEAGALGEGGSLVPDGASPTDSGDSREAAASAEGGPDGVAHDHDSGVRADAEPDVAPGGPCPDAGTCIDVPPGWSLVAYAPSRASACPTGFANNTSDLVEGPTAGPTACSCATCSVTADPTCTGGAVPVHYDYHTTGTGTCATVAAPGTGPLVNSPAGSCGTDLYQGSYASFDVRYTSPPAQGGTCSAPGVVSSAGVTYAAQGRACAPDSAQDANCQGTTCAPAIAGPFKACIMAAGEVACPTGPATVQHVVASAASVTCAGCACSITATCSGTVTVYTDTACKKNPYVVPADDSCDPIYKQAASYNSYIYDGGAPKSVSCTATGTSAAQVALQNESTICCVP